MFHSSPYEKELLNIYSYLTPVSQQYLLMMAKELLKTQEALIKSAGNQQ